MAEHGEFDARQILVWRNDLKIRKGKLAAQIAHASVAWLTREIRDFGISMDVAGQYWSEPSIKLTAAEKSWIEGHFTKICVYVDSEEELLAVHQKALDAGLKSFLITDAGLTEFHGVKTNTCVGIGPAFSEELEPITGNLKLL